MGKNKIKTQPDEAFQFRMAGECMFAESESDGESNGMRLSLYDGSVVPHWYWGNLAFELSSMKLAKKRVPILADHDTAKRIGFSTGASFDGKFILEGKSLDNEDATKLRADAQAGFPLEASLRFDPDKAKIDYIKEGEKVEVNGRTLKGPGALVRNTIIMEGSVCTFGALTNCKTETFSNFMEANTMPEPQELTLETLAAEHKNLYDQVFDAGGKRVRDDFAKFTDEFGDDPAFLVEQFGKGASFDEAVRAQNAKLKADLIAAKNTEAIETTTGKAENGGAEEVSAVEQEFQDEQGAGDADKPKTFKEVVAAYQNENKCSLSKATKKCIDTHKELYKQSIEAANPKSAD